MVRVNMSGPRMPLVPLVLAALVLLLHGCAGTSPHQPDPTIEETGSVKALPCIEMLAQCRELGLDGAQCCDADAAADSCAGSVVSLTLSSSSASSFVSRQDCYDQLDEPVDTYCSGRNRPGDCAGACNPGEDCVDAGEATDKRTTQNGPNVWRCAASKGRCFCDCRR